MKKLRLLSLAVASLFVLNSSRAASFDDIQFWVGSGANQAALVIDWNDGKSAESLLWGYRWDGAATGFDMFQAVVAADSRLFVHIGTFGFGPGVLGLGYDLNNNGLFGVSPSLDFDSNGFAFSEADSNVDSSRAATDAGDHWVESWFPDPGFWGYHVKSSTDDLWAESFVGAGDRVLADGVWDGWSFATGWPGPEPSEPIAAVPVPEPTALAFGLVGSVFFLSRRSSRRREIPVARSVN